MTVNSSTASNDGAASDTSANPNELGTEMSAEDEAAFVDRQLGITDSGAEIEGGDDEGTGDSGEASTGEEAGDDANADGGSTADAAGTGEEGEGTGSDTTSPEAGDDASAATVSNDDEGAKAEGEEAEAQSTSGVDTSDLWVEIEDAEGKTHKVTVTSSLPEGFAFKNDAQLAEYLEARNEMKQTLNQRQADFDKQQQESTAAKAEQEQLAAWDAEVSALVEGKLLDAPKSLPKDGKRYTEAEIKADPALQKINDIYAFMSSKGLRSFGTAYTLWSQEQAKNKEAEELKESNDTAKARGALVGGSSSSSGNDAGYVYSAGSASSIHDVDTSDI
jgi:hypothetical protein